MCMQAVLRTSVFRPYQPHNKACAVIKLPASNQCKYCIVWHQNTLFPSCICYICLFDYCDLFVFFFFANLLRFFFLFLISHSCLTHVLHLNLFLVTVFFFGSSLVFFFVCLILNKYLVLSVQVIFCQHGFFTLKKRICIKITGGNAD